MQYKIKQRSFFEKEPLVIICAKDHFKDKTQEVVRFNLLVCLT